MSEREGPSARPPGEETAVEARLRAMEQAIARIGTTLDETSTCRELGEFLCPSLCAAAAVDLPPHRVLRRLDAAVAEDSARRPATCLLIRVDPARGVATFASAGHLPPAIFTADGRAELVEVPVGPPLGTGVGGYELATRDVTPAETLLLFTDGLVERRDEDIDVSLSRLAAVRMPPGAGVDEVVDEVLLRLDARHAEDDVAVLAARIRPRPPGRAPSA